MADYFLDTSALVKYYFEEPGSGWVKQLIEEWNEGDDAPMNGIYVGDITTVEAPAAFAILHRNGFLSMRRRDDIVEAFLRDMQDLFWAVPVNPSIFMRALWLTQKYPLKAYDAVQLALASRVNDVSTERKSPFVFVSSDKQLLTAAKAEDLAIDNPHDHA